MLRLIPAPLHRALLRLAHGLRQRWWRRVKPQVTGVCVVACDDEGRVLLLRQSYGSQGWTLPGGGIGRRESMEQAAAREFREETGCDAADMAFVAISTERIHGAPHRVHVFSARLQGTPQAENREVVEVRLFSPDDLPARVSRRVLHRLRLAGVAVATPAAVLPARPAG